VWNALGNGTFLREHASCQQQAQNYRFFRHIRGISSELRLIDPGISDAPGSPRLDAETSRQTSLFIS